MAFPETIAVRYTEDEAEYVSLRPIVRQTFQIRELVDMILGVTGKDAARIVQILKSGAVSYHGYRYWWKGFDPTASEIALLLATYPDANATRAFDLASCSAVVIESEETPPRHSLEISEDAATQKRFLRVQSFWDELETIARETPPAYREYSYARRADVYVSGIAPGQAARLAAAAKGRLPRSMHAAASFFSQAARILWILPRTREKKVSR